VRNALVTRLAAIAHVLHWHDSGAYERPPVMRLIKAPRAGTLKGERETDEDRVARLHDEHRDGERINRTARHEAPLSPIECSVVASLVSAIVKELRADQPQPVRRPAALSVRWHTR